jgi:hypothetical protein
VMPTFLFSHSTFYRALCMSVKGLLAIMAEMDSPV